MSDLPTPLILLSYALVAIGVAWLCSRHRSQHQLPRPPGPKPWPIIGNLLDVPLSRPWATYERWQKTYGDIVHFRVFHQTVIVLNSRKVVNDLMDKRSWIYSDRPHIPIVDLIGFDFALALMPYGSEWRRHRRIFHQEFRRDAISKYEPMQLSNVHHLLRQLTDNPENVMTSVRSFTASILVYATYGHQISTEHDQYVAAAEEVVMFASESLSPGVLAVNALPMLQYLPAWFPGANIQQLAQKCRKLIDDALNVPFNSVKDKMKSGIAIPCVTSELLERNEQMGGSVEGEDDIKRTAAIAYMAGADTISAAVSIAILVMVLHPEAQKKAQEEIDRVIGTDRLPDYNDRESLVYVEAFCREIFRWQPPLPLGVFHSTSEDDVYEGHFIPKDSYIIASVWAITHDENTYPNPHVFKPERFITDEGKLNDDSQVMSFGFGRRICPGRYMADSVVWAVVASLLATFNFSKAKDSNGNEIEVEAKFAHGLISNPLPFKCSITPRSEGSRKLVEETVPML